MGESSDNPGEYRRFHSFTLATIIQLETLRFCRRFLTHDPKDSTGKFYDPEGTQYNQMTRAARSSRMSILGGSERASSAKDAEGKLIESARTSLGELRGDYEIFILDRDQLPWSMQSTDSRKLAAVSLDPPSFSEDLVHSAARHALEQRQKYATWLDSEDPLVVANAMLSIIGRALVMLKSPVVRDEPRPVESVAAVASATPSQATPAPSAVTPTASAPTASAPTASATPLCPLCGKNMRRRKTVTGEFWGCTGYPDCKGTRGN